VTDDDRPGARRTCIACREEAARDALIRLVSDPDGALVIDLRGRLPGRGAWVHPTRACVSAVERDPKLASRTLKTRVSGPDLEQQLHDAVLRAVLDGLSLAARAGALVGGHDAIEIAVGAGKVSEVVLANDAAERTVRDLERIAGDRPITRLPIDREALGARVGQPPRAALGLVPLPAFADLRTQLRRLRSLG
jgi:predicted RNA-binding protein YlxR (DUF448 family)